MGKSIWSDGKLPPDVFEDFTHLAAVPVLAPVNERKTFHAVDFLKKAMSVLGVEDGRIEKGYMGGGRDIATASVSVKGNPILTVMWDTYDQTGNELKGIWVPKHAYPKLKGLLPNHKSRPDQGGLFLTPDEQISTR